MNVRHPPTGNVPFPIISLTRIPRERYYDKAFYDLECERLWPRVWQMACRLEEIPKPGDYVEYELLDQSVIIVRVDANRVKAYHNACRHRGVQLVKDRGNAPQGFSCPFHGWRYNLEGANTFVYQTDLFAEADRDPADLRLRECRIEIWGGCAFINLDDNAPPLRASLEPFASYNEARGAADMRTKWWYSTILPVNWKVSMEAFMEGYHVMRTHPQLLSASVDSGPNAVYRPKGTPTRGSASLAMMSRGAMTQDQIIDAYMFYMETLCEGMDAMILDKDIAVAKALRKRVKLTENDPGKAAAEWVDSVHRALTEEHRKQGMPMPDLVELAKTQEAAVQFGFPNFFLLPTFGNMASYRIRPLGPERTLFELWSLTLYPEGQEPPPPKTPVPMAADDPRWPQVPRQDFSNLARQQKGLHTKGFDFMRLSPDVEGVISRFHQVLDGYLSGVDSHQLLPAMQKVSGAADRPVETIRFGHSKVA